MIDGSGSHLTVQQHQWHWAQLALLAVAIIGLGAVWYFFPQKSAPVPSERSFTTPPEPAVTTMSNEEAAAFFKDKVPKAQYDLLFGTSTAKKQ